MGGGGASGPSEVYILQYKKKIVAIIPSGFALQKNITFIIQFCIHLMNPVLWIRIQLWNFRVPDQGKSSGSIRIRIKPLLFKYIWKL